MEYKYITIAPNVWGKADNPDKSKNNARKEHGSGMKHYDTYRVHPDTTVDSVSGGLSYPSGEGNAPVLIKRVRNGKEQPLPK